MTLKGEGNAFDFIIITGDLAFFRKSTVLTSEEVELGKELARTIFPELKKGKVGDHDSSTSGLVSYFLSFKPENTTAL